jgi:hypothetical protein
MSPLAALANSPAEDLETSLAVLSAHARRQGPHGSDRELLARAIARLVVQTRMSRAPAQDRVMEHVMSDEVVDVPYDELVARVQELVSRTVPLGARVAVVSRGDGDLLRIHGCDARHFPAGRDGAYAGFYPPDGQAALAQLTEAIDSGVGYLAVPETGRWWLDFYPEFGAYLRQDCQALFDEQAIGALFELVPFEPGELR